MTDRPSGSATDLPLVARSPVVLPALPAHQELAWSVLLELDERSEPWALVGGQMTLLHCLENGITGARPTDDGDVVLDVWSQREAVRTIGRWLQDAQGFELLETANGFGYRYTRGDTTLDLLIPEGLDRQHTQPPTTSRTRPALPIEGGNQALLRVERVPVRVGSRTGYVRRPSLLGALVLKAAAFVADSRDTQRHAQDIGLLMEAAFNSGSLRSMDLQASAHDRKRLRDALRHLPQDHPCWRSRTEPAALHEAATRLSDSR